MPTTRALLLALTLLPLAASPGRAQVTPERAADLQAQIRDWVQSTLGAGVAVARSPVTVTAAGDHFDVAAPFGASASGTPDAPVVTGKMTDAGGGRWAVNDVTMSSPSVFRYQLPPAKKPGAVGGEAVSTVTIGEQRQSMLIDPTFATPSTSTSAIKNLDITTKLSTGTQLSHIDTADGHSTMTPAADGRVDVAADSAITGYSAKMGDSPDHHPITIAMAKASVTANLTGVSRERGVEILRLAIRAGQPGPGKSSPDPMDRQTSLALVTAFADLANAAVLQEEGDDITVSMQNLTGSLAKATFGLDTKADGGKLRARLPITAEGLRLPDLGLGTLAVFVPTRLTMTPTVAAVPTEAAQRLLRRAVQNEDPNDADIAALFADGPIAAGLDDFAVDVAGSAITGHAALQLVSPSAFTGTGQVTAENIDRLQQAMTADPQAASVAPLLIFLKGIGRTEGSHTVWDVDYREGHLRVNGQDMAALMGAMSPPAAASPTPAPAPAPRPSAPARPARPAPTRP